MVLDGIVCILAVILNPSAKRRRLRETERDRQAEMSTSEPIMSTVEEAVTRIHPSPLVAEQHIDKVPGV